MSYEGDGMKLRDLARSSRSPPGVATAFHIIRSRFANRGTARRSRRRYESVPKSSSALRLLTLLQQTTMVSALSIILCPRHPGSPVTTAIRTNHRDQSCRPRMCHKPPSCIS